MKADLSAIRGEEGKKMNKREEMILKIKENKGAVDIMDPNFKIDGICYKLGDEDVKMVNVLNGDITGLMTFLGLLQNPDVLKISYNAGHVKAALEQWIGGQPLDKIEWYSIKDKSEELGLPANLNDLCDSLGVERGEKEPETIEDCVEVLEEELEIYNLIKDCKSKEDIKGIEIKKVQAKPLNKYFVKNKDGLIIRINDSLIAEDVLKNNSIIVCFGIPYIYMNNAYVMDRKGAILRGIIRRYLDVTVKNQTNIKRIYSYIIDTPSIQKSFEDLNQYPKHWVCFKNCMWDVKNWKAYPNDPKYCAVNQIPYNFTGGKMDGEKTVTEKYFRDFIPKADDREMLKQYIGYSLTTDTSQQKFLVLKGTEGIGKSVILRLINLIVGAENTSNIALERLGDRFTTAYLAGKILNSCGDISSKALEDISVIKQLVGEDPVQGEIKNGAQFYFYSYAKHVFSANQIPLSISEKSGAFYRRLLILKLDERAKYIPDLEDKLAQEIDYTIYASLKALNRMYKDGGKIAESNGSKEEVLELYRSADTVKAFLEDTTDIPDSYPDYKTDRATLYSYYKDYCTQEERAPLSRNNFYTNLRTKGIAEMKSNGTWYFAGVKIKDDMIDKVQYNINIFPSKA